MGFIQMPSVHKFHALKCTNLKCNMYILSTDANQTVREGGVGEGGVCRYAAYIHTHTHT